MSKRITAHAALVERLHPENKQLERFRIKLKKHHQGDIEPIFKHGKPRGYPSQANHNYQLKGHKQKVLIALRVSKWTPRQEVLGYLKKEFPSAKIRFLRS